MILINISNVIKVWVIFSLLFVQSTCVYRFTNTTMRPPVGIGSIAIESVYDTSREVLPHDYLWAELQRAFAASGKLKLTTPNRADALVRVHITKGSQSIRNPMGKKKPRDPQVGGGTTVPFPSRFRNMSVSEQYADKFAVGFHVVAEVWNLNTRQVMMRKEYDGGATINSFRLTSATNQYIMFEETLDNHLKYSMRGIAQRIAHDFLAR